MCQKNSCIQHQAVLTSCKMTRSCCLAFHAVLKSVLSMLQQTMQFIGCIDCATRTCVPQTAHLTCSGLLVTDARLEQQLC